MNTNTKIAIGVGGVALLGVLLRPKKAKAEAMPKAPERVPAPNGQGFPNITLPVVQIPSALPAVVVPTFQLPTLVVNQSAPQKVTVKSGDSLSSIAKAHLAEEALWPAIYDLNRSVVGKNPDVLKVGVDLVLPSVAALTDEKKTKLRRRAALHKQAWVAFSRTSKSGYPTLPAEVLQPTL